MTPPDSSPHNQAAEARLDALLKAARQAPLPRSAERLALGFGARAEARLHAAAAETAVVSRFLQRWVTGLGACAGVALAASAVLHGPTPQAAASPLPSSFQSDWASYTAVPELWPE